MKYPWIIMSRTDVLWSFYSQNTKCFGKLRILLPQYNRYVRKSLVKYCPQISHVPKTFTLDTEVIFC